MATKSSRRSRTVNYRRESPRMIEQFKSWVVMTAAQATGGGSHVYNPSTWEDGVHYKSRPAWAIE